MKKYSIVSTLLLATGLFLYGCSSDDGGGTTPQSGRVVIDATPDAIDAPWALGGPGGWGASGAGDSTLTNLETGDYTVNWSAVDGWTPPAGSTRTLAAGATVTFSGTYTEVTTAGRIEIDAEPNTITAPWSLSGPDGFSQTGNGDINLASVATGSYTLVWGDVDEWITPDPAEVTATLAEGDTLRFYGAYVEENPTRGALVIDPEPNSLNAPWSLGSSTGFSTTGNGDYTAQGMNPGGYTVTWGDINGWVTPRQQTLQLVAGDTIRFEAEYVEEDLGPVACFTVNPTEGTTETVFSFDADCSYDRGGTAGDLRYRWDLDDDGTWDVPGGDEYTTVSTLTHSYDVVTDYTIRLEVKDPAGTVDQITHDISLVPLTTSTIHIAPVPPEMGAPWTLAGPSGYHREGSGPLSLYDMDMGDYTIQWGQVEGWVLLTAALQMQTLEPGVPLTFSSEYQYIGGQIDLSFEPIPSGVYLMGTDELAPYRNPDETQHQVTLTHPFEMMTTEVTNQVYIQVAQWAVDNGYATATSMALYDNLDGSTEELYDLDDADREVFFDTETGEFTCINPDNPVQEITWYGAVAFCDWLSLRAGLPRAYDHQDWLCNDNAPYDALGYRLPTEAEWEYAARAGTTTGFYNGEITNPDCADPLLDLIGWYCGNGEGHNHPVAGLQPNPWGLYDMLGNLWEWCNDWKDDLPSTPVIDPVGPLEAPAGVESHKKVVRGGSWTHTARDARTAARYFYDPYYASGTISFRAARTVFE